MKDGDAIREFELIWKTIVQDMAARTADERPVLGLSGGMDSRTIAAQAVDVGFRPMACTYGDRMTDDVRIASQLAAALGLVHALIPISDTDLLRGGTEAASLLDGAHSPVEMYELWFRDRLVNLTGAVINGHGGGTLWGNAKGLGLRSVGEVAERQWQMYLPEVSVVSKLLESSFRRELPTVIRSSLNETVSRWDLGWRGDMVVFWAFANRQTRWGGMLINALRRSGIRAEAPFLDARLLSFAARLTTEQRRNGNLYLRIHRELFGKTADIPRSDDGNPPSRLDHIYWAGDNSYLRQLAMLTTSYPVSGLRRAWRRAEKVGADWLSDYAYFDAPARAVARRRSVFPGDHWLRTNQAYSERLLHLLEGAVANQYFSASAVEEVISSVRRRRPAISAGTLGKVAAAHAWSVDYRDRAMALP